MRQLEKLLQKHGRMQDFKKGEAGGMRLKKPCECERARDKGLELEKKSEKTSPLCMWCVADMRLIF